ncbi:hypothetical protein Tco_0240129, partial [Tanacetum coccineum]
PRIVDTARSYRTPVNTVRPRVVNTARPNRTSVNAARENGFNAVKPSACWVWRPIKPNSKPQHIGFLENKPMIEGTGPKWLFDIDSLTQSMNYVPVTAGTVSNDSAGTSEENS